MNKTKIVIAGIGAVGGYFGGLLAKHFYNNDLVSIYFFGRGKNLEQIQTNGLKVIKGSDEFIAKPELATDNASEIGIADFIIISTKAYDLDAVIEQLQPCINKRTVILPLLNGVDSRERIKKMLPDNSVLDGCVYIVSRLNKPGEVENKGNIQKLYFGLDGIENKQLILLENLLKYASIEAACSQIISTVIWEKFIFISPTAAATSYFNASIGELLTDKEKFLMVNELIEEIKQVATAKKIPYAEDITQKTIHVLKALRFETTSSMHTDFLNGKNTELESLIGYVVREGEKYQLNLPVYDKIYRNLKLKSTQKEKGVI